MPSCVFRKCNNYNSKVSKADGITYHMFPSNEVKRQEWIAVVRMERSESDWLPANGSTVCSAHFCDEHKYLSNKGLTRIKKHAVPVINERYNYKFPPGFNLTNATEADIEEVIENSKKTNNSSGLETPIKAALKTEVKELILEKKMLQKKNSALVKQNKRLKIRVAQMSAMIKILKQNRTSKTEKAEKNDSHSQT